MSPRTTLFLSTHGRPAGEHAFTVANDDLPERPATAGAALRMEPRTAASTGFRS